MSDKIPKPEEIQKEFEEFVKKRFGGQVQIVSQQLDRSNEGEVTDDNQPETSELNFDFKPKDVKAYLDRYIIKQDEAKKALAIAVCDHYNYIKESSSNQRDYAKQNVLILGDTGVGKTYLVRKIADLIGVPFVKADATRFSETGYVGANVDDLIRDLVNQAEGDLVRASHGIVYLDEADKLATYTAGMGIGRDVSGRGVQLGLLKLMEESEVDLRGGNDPASQIQAFMELQQKGRIERQVINTKHILFIVSGAFNGLSEIIAKRLHRNQIGFATAEGQDRKAENELLRHTSTQDFIDYGFEPEFVGRMPIRVACQQLEAEDLFKILTDSEGSIIRQYESAFASYGISLQFTTGALKQIAIKAAAEKTGARSLMTVCEEILRDYKFYLPSTDLTDLEITEAIIENPSQELEKILSGVSEISTSEKQEIIAIEEEFQRIHQMSVRFTPRAISLLSHKAKEQGKSIKTVCQTLLHSYEHGLKLVQQNTGKKEFILDQDILADPHAKLEQMIRDSYTEARGKQEPQVIH